MAYNLFDLTYRTARLLGDVIEGELDGALQDTINLLDVYEDDYFERGTIWVLRDAGGAGAVPEGEYRIIVNNTKATGKFGVSSAFTAATASGDRYALATRKFPLHEIIRAINETLQEARITTTDSTTITTAADQLEYTLPTAILGEDIEVWFQNVTDDADANEWEPIHDWYIQETGTGTAKKLVLRNQPIYTNKLKLVYQVPHPALYVYTDKLRESVDVNRITHRTAARLMEWRKKQFNVTDPEVDEKIGRLLQDADRYENQGPRKTRAPKMATWGLVGSQSLLAD